MGIMPKSTIILKVSDFYIVKEISTFLNVD